MKVIVLKEFVSQALLLNTLCILQTKDGFLQQIYLQLSRDCHIIITASSIQVIHVFLSQNSYSSSSPLNNICLSNLSLLVGCREVRVNVLSNEVLVQLSICSAVQMIGILPSLCHCYSIISCFVKTDNGLSFTYVQGLLNKHCDDRCFCLLQED